MKKLVYILAAAAMVLLTGCKKDNKGGKDATEVGKWYAYNVLYDGTVNKNDIVYVLELKADKTADFMITAWGSRWQGPYTYDGKVVKITWNKFLFRPAALSDDWTVNGTFIYCTEPDHIYDKWQSWSSQVSDEYGQDPDQFGQTLEISFTYSGDTGEIDLVNKPCPAERQK